MGNNTKNIYVKVYVGLFKEFHDSKFDKKQIFVLGLEN